MISQTVRKFTFAAAAAFLMTASIQAGSIGSLGWTQVAPLGGHFTVAMPGAAQHTTTPINTNGQFVTTMHTYMMDATNCSYSVMYGDIASASSNPGSMLEAVRNGNARGGRVLDDKDFTIDGYPGKAVTIEKDGMMVYNRIVIVGDRVFQVMFAMNKSDEIPASANTFIKSFRLTN